MIFLKALRLNPSKRRLELFLQLSETAPSGRNLRQTSHWMDRWPSVRWARNPAADGSEGVFLQCCRKNNLSRRHDRKSNRDLQSSLKHSKLDSETLIVDFIFVGAGCFPHIFPTAKSMFTDPITIPTVSHATHFQASRPLSLFAPMNCTRFPGHLWWYDSIPTWQAGLTTEKFALSRQRIF